MRTARSIAGAAVLAVALALPASAHEEKDPVCGMMVEIERAFASEVYAGQTFYF